MDEKKKNQFEEAGNTEDAGLLREFIELLRHNKKYWLIPFLVVLLGLGLVILLGGTAAAPFIYTLF